MDHAVQGHLRPTRHADLSVVRQARREPPWSKRHPLVSPSVRSGTSSVLENRATQGQGCPLSAIWVACQGFRCCVPPTLHLGTRFARRCAFWLHSLTVQQAVRNSALGWFKPLDRRLADRNRQLADQLVDLSPTLSAVGQRQRQQRHDNQRRNPLVGRRPASKRSEYAVGPSIETPHVANHVDQIHVQAQTRIAPPTIGNPPTAGALKLHLKQSAYVQTPDDEDGSASDHALDYSRARIESVCLDGSVTTWRDRGHARTRLRSVLSGSAE